MRKKHTISHRSLVLVFGLFLFTPHLPANAFTVPYYSFGEVHTTSAVWVPNVPRPTLIPESAQQGAPTPVSVSAGHEKGDLWGFVGIDQTPVNYDPTGFGSVTSQAASGSIQALSSAYHGGNGGIPVSWMVQLPGTNPFEFQPFTWGEASSFGYIRSVWEITSDGSLPVGETVTIQANLDVGGVLSGYDSTVRAMLFLNGKDDVWWLDAQEYLDFSVVDDFALQPTLEYFNFQDVADSTSVGHSDVNQQDFKVGDIIVMEALLLTTSTLANDGIERSAGADFENTLGAFLTVQTPGASLELFGNPVPIPGAAWLFGSGLIGLVGFARRKKP